MSQLDPENHDVAGNQDEPDRRSPIAKAADISSRLMTISLCLVIPVVGGYYLDKYMNTRAIFVIAGLLFGMAASGWQLFKLTAPGGLLSSDDDRLGDG